MIKVKKRSMFIAITAISAVSSLGIAAVVVGQKINVENKTQNLKTQKSKMYGIPKNMQRTKVLWRGSLSHGIYEKNMHLGKLVVGAKYRITMQDHQYEGVAKKDSNGNVTIVFLGKEGDWRNSLYVSSADNGTMVNQSNEDYRIVQKFEQILSGKKIIGSRNIEPSEVIWQGKIGHGVHNQNIHFGALVAGSKYRITMQDHQYEGVAKKDSNGNVTVVFLGKYGDWRNSLYISNASHGTIANQSNKDYRIVQKIERIDRNIWLGKLLNGDSQTNGNFNLSVGSSYTITMSNYEQVNGWLGYVDHKYTGKAFKDKDGNIKVIFLGQRNVFNKASENYRLNLKDDREQPIIAISNANGGTVINKTQHNFGLISKIEKSDNVIWEGSVTALSSKEQQNFTLERGSKYSVIMGGKEYIGEGKVDGGSISMLLKGSGINRDAVWISSWRGGTVFNKHWFNYGPITKITKLEKYQNDILLDNVTLTGKNREGKITLANMEHADIIVDKSTNLSNGDVVNITFKAHDGYSFNGEKIKQFEYKVNNLYIPLKLPQPDSDRSLIFNIYMDHGIRAHGLYMGKINVGDKFRITLENRTPDGNTTLKKWTYDGVAEANKRTIWEGNVNAMKSLEHQNFTLVLGDKYSVIMDGKEYIGEAVVDGGSISMLLKGTGINYKDAIWISSWKGGTIFNKKGNYGSITKISQIPKNGYNHVSFKGGTNWGEGLWISSENGGTISNRFPGDGNGFVTKIEKYNQNVNTDDLDIKVVGPNNHGRLILPKMEHATIVASKTTGIKNYDKISFTIKAKSGYNFDGKKEIRVTRTISGLA